MTISGHYFIVSAFVWVFFYYNRNICCYLKLKFQGSLLLLWETHVVYNAAPSGVNCILFSLLNTVVSCAFSFTTSPADFPFPCPTHVFWSFNS